MARSLTRRRRRGGWFNPPIIGSRTNPVRSNKGGFAAFFDVASTPPFPRSIPNCPAARPITVRNFGGPVQAMECTKKLGTATVSVGRFPIGLARRAAGLIPGSCAITLVTRNIFFVAMIPLERFPFLARLARCRANGGDPWQRQRNGNIESWNGVCP
jgi:hypothetical protein